MLDSLREFAELVGQALEASPEARGWAALSGAALAVVAGGWRLLRRRGKRENERVRVNVDSPAGQVVDVRLGKRRKEP